MLLNSVSSFRIDCNELHVRNPIFITFWIFSSSAFRFLISSSALRQPSAVDNATTTTRTRKTTTKQHESNLSLSLEAIWFRVLPKGQNSSFHCWATVCTVIYVYIIKKAAINHKFYFIIRILNENLNKKNKKVQTKHLEWKRRNQAKQPKTWNISVNNENKARKHRFEFLSEQNNILKTEILIENDMCIRTLKR